MYPAKPLPWLFFLSTCVFVVVSEIDKKKKTSRTLLWNHVWDKNKLERDRNFTLHECCSKHTYLFTWVMLDNGLYQYWFFFSGINCQWHILSFFPTYNVENSPHFLEKKCNYLGMTFQIITFFPHLWSRSLVGEASQVPDSSKNIQNKRVGSSLESKLSATQGYYVGKQNSIKDVECM